MCGTVFSIMCWCPGITVETVVGGRNVVDGLVMYDYRVAVRQKQWTQTSTARVVVVVVVVLCSEMKSMVQRTSAISASDSKRCVVLLPLFDQRRLQPHTPHHFGGRLGGLLRVRCCCEAWSLRSRPGSEQSLTLSKTRISHESVCRKTSLVERNTAMMRCGCANVTEATAGESINGVYPGGDFVLRTDVRQNDDLMRTWIVSEADAMKHGQRHGGRT